AAVSILIFMAWRAERLSPALPRAWIAGLALAICMGLWWYGLLIWDQGWPKFRDLLHFEVQQRMAGAVHREGMHYYLMLLPALTFPWVPGLLGAIFSIKPAGEPSETLDEADRFLVAWLLGIVLFFSIPGAKLSTYILPAM